MNTADRRIIPIRSEYEWLIAEINELRAEVTRLTALRDDLVLRVCPSLRALYEEKIGSIEREIFAAEMYLREKQRILELLRAQLNRQEVVSYEEAEKTAGEETKQYEEDLNRRSKEAEESQKRWRSTSWSGFGNAANDEPDDEEGESGDDPYAGGGKRDDSGGERQDGRCKADGDGNDQENPGDEGGSDRKDRRRKEDSGEEDGGESGRSGSHGGDPEDDPYSGDGDRAGSGKQSIPSKIKSLYRKIVKRLHPDANPDVTEHERELFNEAQKAYENGDYGTLKRIWEELEGMKDPSETYADTPEDVEKLRELAKKLRALRGALRSEIARVRGEFPYTMKELLENEELLETRRVELLRQLQEIREADAQLAEFIEKVKKEI